MWRAVVNTVMKLRVPHNVIDAFARSETSSFSSIRLRHGVSYSFEVPAL